MKNQKAAKEFGVALLRWLLFLPAGLLFGGAIQLSIRHGNQRMPLVGEFISALAWPLAFFAGALYVLPKFHRTFLVVFGALIVLLESTSMVIDFHRNSLCAETAICAISIIATTTAVAAFWKWPNDGDF